MVRTYYKYDISVENTKKCGVEYKEDDIIKIFQKNKKTQKLNFNIEISNDISFFTYKISNYPHKINLKN